MNVEICFVESFTLVDAVRCLANLRHCNHRVAYNSILRALTALEYANERCSKPAGPSSTAAVTFAARTTDRQKLRIRCLPHRVSNDSFRKWLVRL